MKVSEQLRKSILQAAIQGKLTEQHESDGTAYDLLQEIKAEKEQLVKDEKIKKEKPLAPINGEEIPFDIPENWSWTRLGNVVYINQGQSVNKNSTNAPTKEVILYEFHQGKGLFTERLIGKSNVIVNNPPKISKPDSLLLSVRAPVGPVNITNREVAIGRGLCELRPLANVDVTFLYFWMLYFGVELDKSSTGTTFSGTNLAAISSLLIPLPPLAEQQRIVERIEELLPELDKLKEQEEIASKADTELPEKLRKSFLQTAIQGELTEQLESDGSAYDLLQEIKAEKEKLIKDKKIKKEKPLAPITEEEIPFDIPENWSWVRLGDLATTLGGYAFKSTKYTQNGYRVIRISDFNENGLVNTKIVKYQFDEKLEFYKLKNKDILLCMTGGTVGKSYQLSEEDTKEILLLNQRVARIRTEFVCSEYIYYLIRSGFVQDLISRNKNSTNDNISMHFIQSLVLPLPPLSEQHRIVDKLDSILKEIEDFNEKVGV